MGIDYERLIGDLRATIKELEDKHRARWMSSVQDPIKKRDHGFVINMNERLTTRVELSDREWSITTVLNGVLTVLEVKLGRHSHSCWALMNAADKLRVVLADMQEYEEHLNRLDELRTEHPIIRRMAEGEMSEVSEALDGGGREQDSEPDGQPKAWYDEMRPMHGEDE